MMKLVDYIQCKKTIRNKRRPILRTENRHKRMTIDLDCALEGVKMTMFIRQLEEFPEDFTVGLKIDTPNPIADFDIVLVRFQGPHGGQSLTKNMEGLHNNYHVHLYSENDLGCRRKKASLDSQQGNFNSLEEAICCFMAYCNIEDPNNIFADEHTRSEQLRWEFQ